ncbi:hypothetical protein MHYP_G00265230 [Metynnis hypsauchen]
MSGHCSPLLSWVTLLLCLSSVTLQVSAIWRPASSQRERKGVNTRDQPYSQVALLPVKSRGAELDSEQQDGLNGVSLALDNRTAISKRAVSERAASEADAGPLCAYRVLDDGKEGRLCFRHTQVDVTCPSGTCRQVRSPGGHLVANMLSNGSVLLQWTHEGQGGSNNPGNLGVPSGAPELTASPTVGGDGETVPTPPKSPSRGQPKQKGGFRMSCWWNGSYTQFECASITLGSSCRDFLLTELHENVPYRICLQPLRTVWDGAETGKPHWNKMKTTAEIWDGAGCVDFIVSPSGMQDIVIAMTTVGGAICVMLVIICLLVAYITENIMSPSVQHTLAARHSTRSHNTHL